MLISGSFGDANISLFTVVTGVGDGLCSKDWIGLAKRVELNVDGFYEQLY